MTTIYLRRRSPVRLFCHLWRRASGKRFSLLYGVAPDRVYRLPLLPKGAVSSYLAFPSLPRKRGGISLLHFPWDRSRLPLAVILALWSPDFPRTRPFGTAPAAVLSAHGIYYRTKAFFCQIKNILHLYKNILAFFGDNAYNDSIF